MKINELFNQSVEYHWTRQKADMAHAEFVIGEIKYLSVFYKERVDDIEISSKTAKTLKLNLPIWTHLFKAYLIDKTKEVDEVGITGTGNAPQVFATELKIIKEFIQQHPRIILYFTAEELSRKKLYNRMTAQLSNNVEIRDDYGSAHYFVYA